jgi:dTDP-4-amino-4,6-dideoxygalactose transaminase
MEPVFDTVEEFWGACELQQAWNNVIAGGLDFIEEFEHRFTQSVSPGSTGMFVTGGRIALRRALELTRRRGRQFVIAPVFCCKVVGEAILSAGLRPYLVDSGSMPGSIDWNECEKAILTGRVSALIVPYLFGLPLDIRPVLEIARQHGVAVIEDCASCFGGKIGDAVVGSLGDFAVFSFNSGKPLFLGGGGLLVQTNHLVAGGRISTLSLHLSKGNLQPETERRELENHIARLRIRRAEVINPTEPKLQRARSIARTILGPAFWYVRWVRNGLLHRKDPADDFNPPPSVGSLRAALGLILLEKYPLVLGRRNENFELLRKYLPQNEGVEFVRPGASIVPAWLNARAIFSGLNVHEVDEIARALCRKGFCAGRVYGHTMDHFVPIRWKAAGQRQFLNARRHSLESIELPIHQNLNSTDLYRMASAVVDHVRSIRQ